MFLFSSTKSSWVFGLLVLLGACSNKAPSSESAVVLNAQTQSAPPAGPMSYPVNDPRIFFSDLESGPNSGGENNAGAIVTIYGSGFGAQQQDSLVTIGAGKAARYSIWSDTKIAFQLGSAATTGEIKVARAGKMSNAVPFKVRAGRIFFLGANGKDGNAGSFASPWKNFTKARDAMKEGDITYALDGASQVGEDQYGARATMSLGGKFCNATGEPRALVGYPGAKATLGSVDAGDLAVRSVDLADLGGICPGGWVFAGLNLRAKETTLAIGGGAGNWRVVGNDISCPNGNGQSGCVETGGIDGKLQFYGNHVHDAGAAKASALYHGIYFGSDSNHIDMGWNIVENIRGCRGVQIHSSRRSMAPEDHSGQSQYDIVIHDNIIHDTQCDGIIFATVDPSKGKIEVYNNIIYNAGKGPNNPEGSGNWACIYFSGDTNNGPPNGGTVEVYNNTLFHCGTFAKPPYDGSRAAVMNGGHNDKLIIRMRNNIVVQLTGIPYLVGANHAIIGANNLFFGNGAVSSNFRFTGTIAKDPQLMNLTQLDFHLSATSPAKGAGVDAGQGMDLGALPFITPVPAVP